MLHTSTTEGIWSLPIPYDQRVDAVFIRIAGSPNSSNGDAGAGGGSNIDDDQVSRAALLAYFQGDNAEVEYYIHKIDVFYEDSSDEESAAAGGGGGKEEEVEREEF